MTGHSNVVPYSEFAKARWEKEMYVVMNAYNLGYITRDSLLDNLESLGWDRDVALDLILEDEEE
jgi:hypothetical protein